MEEHDCDVRFKSGSGNMAILFMFMHLAIIIGADRSLWTGL